MLINREKPLLWIASLYFAQALPYILITVVSVIMYKNMQVSNTKITFYTSLFALPWALKPFLAPPLEQIQDKKFLTIFFEAMLAILGIILAIVINLKNFFVFTVSIFLVAAIIATLHDISSDGVYIVNLDKRMQAKYVGTRSLFYQAGRLVAQGGLVFIAGIIALHLGAKVAWQIGLILFSMLMFFLAIYHSQLIPQQFNHGQFSANKRSSIFTAFHSVYTELMNIPFIMSIVIFAVIYNFPEAQLFKIVPLFMIDTIKQGGLNLSTANVGLIFGGIGTIAMLVGITAAGELFSKATLKQYIVPITFLLGISNIGYVVISLCHVQSIEIITILIIFSQFCFGMSNGAFMVFLLYIFGRGSYPMSSYAIGTALMSLGVMLAGATSGYIQACLGYFHFFIWVLLLNIGILLFAQFNVKHFALES